MKPLISVLMPVYNAERYLVAAMESVLGQTLPDFEFLIIDDGSTDRSRSILEQYASCDRRIRLVSRPNTGHARALNEMLAMARGELLARMDADDISLPDRFARQVRFLNEHPEVVCVGGAFDMIDAKGRFLTRSSALTDNESIQRFMIHGNDALMHPTMMIRRIAMKRIGGYAEGAVPAETLDLALKLGEVGALANLAEPVLRYRIHSKSVCAMLVECQVRKQREVTEAAWRRRGIQGHFEAADRWRPGTDRTSRQAFMLQYGWWAFNSRQSRTAALYGFKAIAVLPWRWAGWNLLACALIKRA